MSDKSTLSRLRGAFKNAIVWGVSWGALGTVVTSTMRFMDKIPPANAILDAIGMGIRIGFMGGIAGAAFAAFISLAYRGKRLSEISWARFGLGAAVLIGLFVPAFLETMNLLTGGHLVALSLVADDFLFSAAFAGITAAGTMKLAQSDETRNPVTVQSLLERMEAEQLSASQDFDRQQLLASKAKQKI
jgi:hypothetical protein